MRVFFFFFFACVSILVCAWANEHWTKGCNYPRSFFFLFYTVMLVPVNSLELNRKATFSYFLPSFSCLVFLFLFLRFDSLQLFASRFFSTPLVRQWDRIVTLLLLMCCCIKKVLYCFSRFAKKGPRPSSVSAPGTQLIVILAGRPRTAFTERRLAPEISSGNVNFFDKNPLYLVFVSFQWCLCVILVSRVDFVHFE